MIKTWVIGSGGLLGKSISNELAKQGQNVFTPSLLRGQTEVTVKVRYATFLMWGKASKLNTITQTREFVRGVRKVGGEWGAGFR